MPTSTSFNSLMGIPSIVEYTTGGIQVELESGLLTLPLGGTLLVGADEAAVVVGGVVAQHKQ